MKKLFFLSLLFIGFQVNAQQSALIYDDNAQIRQVGSFTSIKVHSNIDLYLTQSDKCKVAVSASNTEIRNRIQATVEGGTLILKLENSNGWNGWSKWGNYKMKAYISVKDLESLTGSGASNIRLLSKIATPKLQLKLSGASDLRGEIEAGIFDVNLSGASDFKGQVNATSFLLDASGASTCELSGAAEDMSIELSGASDAKLYNLLAKGAILSTSGASTAKVNVSQLLKAHASGGSDIRYKGDAVLKSSNSSGGSIIKHQD